MESSRDVAAAVPDAVDAVVDAADPKAFTIIVESNEVVGEGFKEELPDIEL